MAKYGIVRLIYNHDRRLHLLPWNHPYAKAVPAYFALLIRDAGFPTSACTRGSMQRGQEDTPGSKGGSCGGGSSTPHLPYMTPRS